jgi:hypothetical protein
MDAFAEGGYAVLLANGCACFAGILAVGLTVRDQRWALAGITAVTLLALVSLSAPRARRWLQRQREPQWLSEWLAQLRKTRESTRVCAVHLSTEPLSSWTKTLAEWEQTQRRRRRHLADQIARWLRSLGRVTIGPRGEVIWFERGDGRRRISDEWLVRRTGGFVHSIRDVGTHNDGEHALGSACDQGLLGPDFVASVRAGYTVGTADVKRSFAEAFPDDLVYSPDEAVPAQLASLPAQEQKGIFSDAVAFARAFRPTSNRSRFAVSAFCEEGELRLIFVIDADSGSAHSWAELVGQLNIDAAVGALPIDRPAAPAT